MNTIGIKIRHLRIKKGYSQQNFAYELGISQPSYARLEQDDNRISITRLMQISIILEIDVAVLLSNNSIEILNQKEISKENKTNLDIIQAFNNEHITTLKDEIIFLRSILKTISTGKKSFWI